MSGNRYYWCQSIGYMIIMFMALGVVYNCGGGVDRITKYEVNYSLAIPTYTVANANINDHGSEIYISYLYYNDIAFTNITQGVSSIDYKGIYIYLCKYDNYTYYIGGEPIGRTGTYQLGNDIYRYETSQLEYQQTILKGCKIMNIKEEDNGCLILGYYPDKRELEVYDFRTRMVISKYNIDGLKIKKLDLGDDEINITLDNGEIVNDRFVK